ncbi:MAG TPA: hypothetical protein VGX92_04740 [Pyrinomonadaceae bacterium]|nr:hypothetical protein [Pyrinomonadaceae bacterium]
MEQNYGKLGGGKALKKGSISVPITKDEETMLTQLVARYQDAVITRNRKTGETASANVHVSEIMRAGLVALHAQSPEKLRQLIINLDRRKKGRPRINE